MSLSSKVFCPQRISGARGLSQTRTATACGVGKDLDAHQVGFINDQDRSLFFCIDFEQYGPEGFGQKVMERERDSTWRESRICLRSSRIVPVLAVTGMIRYSEG